ncbi:WD domain, G-beta repeat [Caballeronia glebae]|uniref:WD domain, G-beta repeat n=1 Tax=Caballeronia glebae TaxID=1777143 RepID=A0A158CM10_9BURK|nr:WD40 repeat domain-containing protein [Caballeronia glebae]SAK83378.1 WD domain, G-beta repeat [Caballeronia glebae]
MNAPTPLVELLGASWTAEACVTAATWNADGSHAGLTLGDGTLVLAPGKWEGGPRLKPHETRGVELIKATAPPPPLARFPVHDGVSLGLAADPDGGFLSAGDDGRLVQVDIEGNARVLATAPGRWIDHVATSRAGLRAYASGRLVRLIGAMENELTLPASSTALMFSPSGQQLAIAHAGGVTLWDTRAATSRLLACPGLPRALAWSPDGRYLVSGMEGNALHGWRLPDGDDIELGGYPLQPGSLSFAADGRVLVTNGGPRAVCWRFDPPGAQDRPRECGVAGSAPVSLVACHPSLSLIALGYHSGAVLLCQPGGADVLFVRANGGAPVSALAWAPDGGRLAYGTEAGEIALVYLPHALFRIAGSQ